MGNKFFNFKKNKFRLIINDMMQLIFQDTNKIKKRGLKKR